MVIIRTLQLRRKLRDLTPELLLVALSMGTTTVAATGVGESIGRPATSEEVFLAGRFVKQYQELLSAESDDATETSKPGTPTGQIDDGTTGQNAGTAQDAAQKATQGAGLATKPATAVSQPKKDTPESASKTPVADNARPDPKASDRDRARTELIHAFMNSNELIYVD